MSSESPETRRRRRQLLPAVGFAYSFLIAALVIAAIILLVIYLTGGFGEGGE